jgi:hypothetical protein
MLKEIVVYLIEDLENIIMLFVGKMKNVMTLIFKAI